MKRPYPAYAGIQGDGWHGDEALEVLTTDPDEVLDVLASPGNIDRDGHSAQWWTQQLIDGDFFKELNVHDFMQLLTALCRDRSHWTQDLRRQLRSRIEVEIDG